jgi:CheY-like chemotaxis protein
MSPDGAAQPRRVLVIDDEEEVRTLLERQLRRLGYEVLLAVDGAQGLAAALSSRPQVILTDLRMPGMDGHTLLRRLAAAGLAVSVIVMSGHGNMEDVIDVLRAGALDYLRKPWSPAELAAAIERGMEKADRQGSGPVREKAVTGEEPRLAVAAKTDAPASDPFEQILARLRAGELPIPATPAMVESLRSAVQRPNVNLDELVSIIERDQRLAADVLRLANTAAYARGSRIHSIKVAVSRIGFRQLHAIVETIALRGLFQAENPELRRLIAQVWRSSVARATTMRELASLLERDGPPAHRSVSVDTAYLIGLMADIGASFILYLVGQRSSTGLGAATPQEYLSAVHAHHQAVGAALLGQWMTDAVVVAAVGDHHPAPDAQLSDQARMSVVASELLRSVPGAVDVTARPPTGPLLNRCLGDLRLDQPRLAGLTAAINERFRETMDLLG